MNSQFWGIGTSLCLCHMVSSHYMLCNGATGKIWVVTPLVPRSNNLIGHSTMIYCIPPCIWQVDCSAYGGGAFPIYCDYFAVALPGPVPLPGMVRRLPLTLAILDPQFCSPRLRRLLEALLNLASLVPSFGLDRYP